MLGCGICDPFRDRARRGVVLRHLARHPFVVIVLSLSSGILVASSLGLPLLLLLTVAPVGALTGIVFAVRGTPLLSAAASCIALASCGAAWHVIDLGPREAHAPDEHVVARVRAAVKEVPLPPHPGDPDPQPAPHLLEVLPAEGDAAGTPCAQTILVRISGAPPEMWPGDVIEITADLRTPPASRYRDGYDRRAVLARQGIHLEGHAPARTVGLVASGFALAPRRLCAQLRYRLAKAIRESLSWPEGELCVALLLGHRPGVDPSDRARFTESGLGHVLAVSGLHLAILAGMAGRILRALGVRRRWAAVVLAALAILYALVAGGRPPIIRSAVMVVAYLAAPIVGRDRDAPNSVGFAATVLLLLNPGCLFDAGFQLSFCAVAFLAFLFPVMENLHATLRGSPERWMDPLPENRFERLASRLRQAALASTAAWFGVQPLLIHYLGILNPWGIVSNIVMLPAVMCALACSVVLAVFTAVLPASAALCAPVMEWALWVLMAGVDAFARLPFSVIHVRSPGAAWLAAYYAAAMALFLWGEARAVRPGTRSHEYERAAARRSMAALIAWGTGCLAVGIVIVVLGRRPPGATTLTVLDFGASRASVIQNVDGSCVLLNAGSPGRPSALADRLVTMGVGQLSAAVITSDDATRTEGLECLLQRWSVDSVALPNTGSHTPSETVLRAGRAARRDGAAVVCAQPSDEIAAANGAYALSWPNVPFGAERGTVPSLICFDAGEQLSILALDHVDSFGNRTARAPPARLPTGGVLLVLSGTRAGRSLRAIVERAAPRLAVVCASRVEAAFAGHGEIMATLADAGVRTASTANGGSIRVTARDDTLRVETWNGEEWVETVEHAPERFSRAAGHMPPSTR
jgi:competence protein ComEC